MKTPKSKFVEATEKLGLDLVFASSKDNGTVNACLRYSHDFSDVARKAGKEFCRKQSGFDWTRAKMAVREAQKKHLAPVKKQIKDACKDAGFNVHIRAVNVNGDSLDVAASEFAKAKGGAVIVDNVVHRTNL